MNIEDTLRPEYLADLIKSGVRNKYASRYRKDTNSALVNPDLHKLVPNSKSVNRERYASFLGTHYGSSKL